jgi:hypothetical protein
MNIFLYHNTSINKSNNLAHFCLFDASYAFAGGDKPSKTINGDIPALLTKFKCFGKILCNFKGKNMNINN